MNAVGAVLLAGIAAIVGGRLGWLTTRGAVAASLFGAVALQGAGLRGGTLFAIFFVSGSLLTRWSERDGLVPPTDKGSRRDDWQVAANGAWAAAGAATIHTSPTIGWSLMTGALAAAQADTWATEIGARAAAPPRLITSGAPVARGASGGVTPIGTMGGVLGAIVMALGAAAVGAPPPAVISGVAGGVLGMTVDSVVGATVQGEFDDRPDTPRHLIRGWSWCTNDVVNFMGTGVGAATGLGLGWLWSV